MDPSEPSVDELVALLQARVEQRRAAGEYPDDLEERLDAHYRRLVGPGPGVRRGSGPSSTRASPRSSIPTRERRSHRPRASTTDLAAMRAAIETLARRDPRGARRRRTRASVQQIDDLRADLSRLARAARAAVLAPSRPAPSAGRRRRRPSCEAWFGWDEFERAFRGSEESVRDRYRDLAARFAGCAARCSTSASGAASSSTCSPRSVSPRAESRSTPTSCTRPRAAASTSASATSPSISRSLPDASLGGRLRAAGRRAPEPAGVRRLRRDRSRGS